LASLVCRFTAPPSDKRADDKTRLFQATLTHMLALEVYAVRLAIAQITKFRTWVNKSSLDILNIDPICADHLVKTKAEIIRYSIDRILNEAPDLVCNDTKQLKAHVQMLKHRVDVKLTQVNKQFFDDMRNIVKR
jgi:hypothetical protein